MISTVDVETRHVHKTVAHRQDGYKGHVVVEPDTGLFTGGKLTKATGEDNQEAAVAVDLLAGETATSLEILGDSAYGTGQARTDLAAAGHTPVIKPMPLRPAVVGGSPSTTSPPTSRHRDLPERTHPADQPQTQRHLRGRLPWLPMRSTTRQPDRVLQITALISKKGL